MLHKYFSASQIKATFINLYDKAHGFCITIYKMAKEIYERDDAKAYRAFTSRICRRMLLVFESAWGAFAIVLTIRYFGQGLSLLIEGWSGTMTVEFETAWIVLAIKIMAVVFVGLFVVAVYISIQDFIATRRKLKASTSTKNMGEFVTENTCEQFRKEVDSQLININGRLDNIERILNTLVERQSKNER